MQWSAFCGQITKTMTQWLFFVNQPLAVSSVKECSLLSSSSVYSQTLTSLFGDASAASGQLISGKFQKPRCRKVPCIQCHGVGKFITILQSIFFFAWPLLRGHLQGSVCCRKAGSSSCILTSKCFYVVEL